MTHNLSDVTEPSVSRPTQVPSFDIAGARTRTDSRWHDGHPAGAIELTDTELRAALIAAPICSENASISTTWCDNPNVC
jgi:hypothetical protein